TGTGVAAAVVARPRHAESPRTRAAVRQGAALLFRLAHAADSSAGPGSLRRAVRPDSLDVRVQPAGPVSLRSPAGLGIFTPGGLRGLGLGRAGDVPAVPLVCERETEPARGLAQLSLSEPSRSRREYHRAASARGTLGRREGPTSRRAR